MSAERIPVGSAYIVITPEMNQVELRKQLDLAQKEIAAFTGDQKKLAEQVAELQTKLLAYVTKVYGEEAAKRVELEQKAAAKRSEFNKTEVAGYLKALSMVTEAHAKAEAVKTAAAEKAAAAQDKALRTARDLEIKYGKEVADAYLTSVAEMEAAGKELTSARIASAKQWATLEATEARKVAAEEAAQDKARAAQRSSLSRLIIRQAGMEAAAAKTAARETTAAYTQAYNTRRTQILSELETEKSARVAATQAAIKSAEAQKAANLQTIRQGAATVRTLQSNARKVEKSWTGAVHGMGSKVEGFGSTMSEFGRSITRNLVTPLMTAAGAMSYLGVSAADSMMQAQTALQRMGVSNKDTSKEINTLKNYGTATPYSVEDMFKYGTQYTRAGTAHGLSSKKASARATSLVQAIGNLSAYAGVTDPAQVQRAMYAVSIMQDADRASLRNVKSLADNAGIPIEELAKSFGFSDRSFTKKETKTKLSQQKKAGVSIKLPKEYTASAQMMDWMANAKTTGGVPGEGVVDALLKRAKDPKIAGAAVSSGSATVGTRLANMWEQGKYGLANLFIKPKGKDGTYEYSGAGEALMGKKHVDNRKYIQTGVGPGGVEKYKKNPNYGKTTYQGGLLNTVTSLASDLKGPSAKLVKELFKDLTIFAGWVKDVVKVLHNNPGLTNLVIKAGKLAALVGGAAIVFGSVIKIFGKILKLGSPIAGIAKGAFKLTKGTAKLGTAAVSGLVSAAKGNGFKSGFQSRRTAQSPSRQVDEINVNTSQAQRNVTQLDTLIQGLKDELKLLKDENLKPLAEEFAGKDSSVKAKAELAAKAVRDVETSVKNLRALQLTGLDDEFKKVTQKDDEFKTSVKHSETAVNALNDKNLNGVTDEFKGLKSKTDSLISATKHEQTEVNKLNALALTALRGEVKAVKDEADATSKKFGSGETSLIHRVGQLNGLNTKKIVDQIANLKKKLEEAGVAALGLNTELKHIADHAPNGGNHKVTPPKKHGLGGTSTSRATGGILPGYTPGKDVHHFVSPTAGNLHLSGGEAIMRPEWTQAVGPGFVDKMNLLARTKGVGGVRKEMKFANGGVFKKFGLDKISNFVENFDIGPDALAAVTTMTMDATSDGLGGDTRSGVVGAGTSGAHFIGSDMASKFKGIFNFLSKDSWEFLKKLPLPDGLSQLIGIVGGAIGPVAGQYAWDDVWKGKGNILQRGDKFLTDLFSWDTLKDSVTGLFTGTWDSVKALWDGGTDFLSDPAGAIADTVSGVWDMAKSEYNGVVDMVKSAGQIWNNPMGYASQVVGDIYDTAKDSLPNTKGLFDFSGNKVSAVKPDVADKIAKLISEPGSGGSVKRWAPQVKMALAQLGLSPSNLDLVLHRIGVESGGNPSIVNNWDSNAKMGNPSQGLMQTIPQTFQHYAGPYLKRGILDPMANIYAGLNYAVHRYGKGWQKALSGTKGYATGTDGAAKGWAWVGEEGPELVNFGGGETVLTHQDSKLAAVKALRGYASGTGAKRTTGVAADAEKSVSSLNSAVNKLYQIIKDAFTSNRIGSKTANSLNKWLDGENKQLQKIVKDRTALAPKLKDANAKLAQVKKDESAMASSISDKAVGLRSLSDVFNDSGVSASAGLNSLHERLAAIKSFQTDLTALTKKGFSKDILSEIAQAGPEQGDAMAKELLKSTAAQVSDYNKTYTAIGTASNDLGKSVAGSYYSAGKKAAQSLVDGLTAKDNKLKKQIEGIADTITNTLKKKLHFNSKTQVSSGLASLLTWLTGEGQAVKGGGSTAKKKTVRVRTTYSTDSKGRKVTTVTTTTSDPAKGTTTTVTERTVGGKTTKTTSVSKLKGYATGTRSASPGVALVGEKGPELINFNGGERVFTNRETAGMVGPKYEIHVHEAKAENTTQAVLRAMKYAETMAAL
jgi:SLT domain-containing protein